MWDSGPSRVCWPRLRFRWPMHRSPVLQHRRCANRSVTRNGQSCHASVTSDRRAVREINIAIPAEVDILVIGGAITDYVTTLM